MKRVILILALVFGFVQADNGVGYNTFGFTMVYQNGVRLTILASDGLFRAYIHSNDLINAGRVLICEANPQGLKSIDDFVNALEKNFDWEFGYRETKVENVTLKCVGTGVQ